MIYKKYVHKQIHKKQMHKQTQRKKQMQTEKKKTRTQHRAKRFLLRKLRHKVQGRVRVNGGCLRQPQPQQLRALQQHLRLWCSVCQPGRD